MRWPGPPIGPKYFYALIDGHTANYSDFAGHGRMRVDAQGVSDTLWIPVVTTQDTRPEHDETFEMGLFADGTFHSCVVTIVDDDAPAINGVAVTSTPVRGDTYRSGENIDITLTFDMAVDAADDAWLTLRLGDGDQHTPREARYLRGSGTRHLVFRYQVQPSDSDPDGIAVSGTAHDDGSTHGLGGTYASGTDVPVDPTHAGLETAANHKVDGRPYVKSVGVVSTPPDGWEAYRADQTIEIALTFDTAVVVEGEVRLGLYVGLVHDNWAEAWREADYLRGSGADTLVFGYTVVPGDTDIRGIAIPGGGTAVLGSGTIKADGTDVEYQMHFPATGHLPDHKIDTAAPTLSGIYLTSRPANGQAYQAGEVIRVEVVFSEPVTRTGDLQLELDIGGENRRATLRPDTNPNRRFNNDMVFEYQVQADDTDPDGIEVSANSIQLNGGTIHDRAGNAAVSHQPVAADPHQKVSTDVEY
ncbi:MAG: hypothetical protein F4Y40_04665 [Acidimicrobiia bacterium]|nr:hypothetical protein [Acidimicrobiia bacterium]